MESFVLGVDLDGVVGDFYAAIRKVAVEWLGRDESDLDPEVRYGLPEWGFTPETYPPMHRFGVTQRGLVRELEPIEGCASDAPTAFWPPRSRTADHPAALDFHGIPYRDLCFTGDKVAVGADMYVEDTADNVTALRSVAPTIVFTNSTTRCTGSAG